jgi:HAD superfamily hydrolase (TIGR01549 family)
VNQIRALFLDLDETLLDGSGFPASIARTCEEIAQHRPGLKSASLLEANAEIWARLAPEIMDRWERGEIDCAAVRSEAWRRTLAACRCHDEAVAKLAAETHRRLACQTYRLFDDVHDLLFSLRRACIPTALITNGGSDTQREKLTVLNLEPWFDVVIVSGEVRLVKPDAAVFALALDRLGIGPESVWHVGDNLRTDVAGAKAANLTAVWLNRRALPRGPNDPIPDAEIRSLADLHSASSSAAWLSAS